MDQATVRWDGLFADMEAQLAAAQAADLAAEVAERTRAELAGVALADRLRAQEGGTLTVRLADGSAVVGRLADVSAQWLLLEEANRQHLVPLAAVDDLAGLGTMVAAPGPTALRRLGLGHALRALARDRVVVQLVTRSAVLRGRVQRVSADHLDLAVEHGERPGAGGLRTVPFAAVLVVHSA